MFTSILVAVDGSEPAGRALIAACDIAKRYDAKLHLAHTPQIDTFSYAMGAGVVDIPPTAEEIMAAGTQVLADAAAVAKSKGVTPATKTLGAGDPAKHVIETAKANGVDLIVTGRRGLGSLSSLVLGSTSQRIAHDAPCAILTVK